MKIGIDARLWNETGVGRYIRNLVWQLQKIDKENDYVLFVNKGSSREALQISGQKIKLVETDIRWHTIAEQVQFPKLLKKEQLDLVHFPYFSVPVRYDRPFVITIHDLIINHFPTGKASTLPFPVYNLKHLGYQFVMKQSAKKAKKIMTVSEATKQEIIDHLNAPEDKIVVTHEGVDEMVSSSKYQVVSIKKEKLDTSYLLHNTKYFLYVGNAYPHKNLEMLVDAFGSVVQSHPAVKLFLVGKEDFFYKRIKQRVQVSGLNKSVIFKGNVSDEELTALYTSAVALVAPSLMEGFGLPPLEAMARNCTVVVSSIAAHKEVCADAASYFNPYEKDSLVNVLEEALAKHESAEYAVKRKRGAERVKRFSWEKMARQTLAVYTSTI